jgi:hypothetical protein
MKESNGTTGICPNCGNEVTKGNAAQGSGRRICRHKTATYIDPKTGRLIRCTYDLGEGD